MVGKSSKFVAAGAVAVFSLFGGAGLVSAASPVTYGAIGGGIASEVVETFGPSIVAPFSLNPQNDHAQTLYFPKFDSSLGSLSKVVLTLVGNATTTIKVTAPGTGLTNLSLSSHVDIVIQDGGHLTMGGTLATKENPQFEVNGLSTYAAVIAGGNKNVNAGASNESVVSEYVDSATLLSFTGSGNKSLDIVTFVGYVASWTGENAQVSRETKVGVTGSVTYTYSHMAVPEATTLLLGLACGMPLLMHRGRRRATKA